MASVRDVDFQPTQQEREIALRWPADKDDTFMRGFSLGGTSHLRRSRRAAQEGRHDDAQREYHQAITRFALAVPAAPVGWIAGLITQQKFKGGATIRSLAGVREETLARRLGDLLISLNALARTPLSDFFHSTATTQDLTEAVQIVAQGLDCLEQRLVARAVPRLRDSVLIKNALAKVRAAHATFASDVQVYTTELSAWEAIRPDLVPPRRLAPAPSALAPAPASVAAVAEAPPVVSDRTVTFEAQEGAASLDVAVATQALCARSDYFLQLYRGPLGLSDAQQKATLVVPDPALGREAILAVMTGKAPAFTPDNYLALHSLFDMWQCEDMLTQWHAGMGDYLRAVGAERAMSQAAAQSPGSSLSESLFVGAWDHFLPVTAQHFLQAYPPAQDKDPPTFRSSHASGDLWSRSSATDDAAVLDLRWRFLQTSSTMRSDRIACNGLEVSLVLTDNVHDEMDAYRLQMLVHAGPTQPTGIVRLRAERGSLEAVQQMHIAGQVNGLPVVKRREIHRSRGADGALGKHVYHTFDLCVLGAHGAMAGQNKPLFSHGGMALDVRVAVTGLFSDPDDAG